MRPALLPEHVGHAAGPGRRRRFADLLRPFAPTGENHVPEASIRRLVTGAAKAQCGAKFGGMDVSEAKRLKSLEDENAKLKRLLMPCSTMLL